MPKYLAAFNPNSKASYSAVLFVVINSNLYISFTISPPGDMKRNPALEPSLQDDPSKYNCQSSSSYSLLHLTSCSFSTCNKPAVLSSSLKCNMQVPKSLSTTYKGWFVGFLSSVTI